MGGLDIVFKLKYVRFVDESYTVPLKLVWITVEKSNGEYTQ